MGNYSKQRIGKYVSHKMCCVAQTIVDTDKLSQYGIENLECRINNDFIATVFLEILQCSDYKNIWEHAEQFGITVSVPTPGAPVKISHLKFVDNNDATQEIKLTPLYYVFTATSMPDALNELVEQINLYQDPDRTDMRINAINDGGELRLIIESDTEIWDDYSLSQSTTNLTLTVPSPASYDNRYYLDEGDTDEFACLTESQICDIVEWLNIYCDKCSEDFSVKTITEELT